jgi:hypothetical protein
MGSSNIRAKIKRGLAKAVNRTGSSDSERIYLVTRSGGGTPVNPTSVIEIKTLLVNAIFKNYEQGLTDSSIKAGDRQLVANNDVKIKTNDIIEQGSTRYIVIDVDEVAPTSDVLAYFCQVRVQ